jgi:transcriptional activator of cad operon
MERESRTPIRIGAWRVDPVSGEMSRDGEIVRLEIRALRLLVYLAERAGDIVSLDDLLRHVWPDVIVSAASVYQAVASLRRVLGDDAKEPTYIATVPRLGYRLVATVSTETTHVRRTEGPAVSATTPSEPARNRLMEQLRMRPWLLWPVGTLCLAVAVGSWLFARTARADRAASAVDTASLEKSVAVLPFVDLTEKMSEEEFADGLTEEVISRLSKLPNLRVPPPTSSFVFKNKRRSVVDIANALKVVYVLDGSTRKSGLRLRVAVRLVRADSGVLVWSDSYERPWGDMLSLQDDIATQVTTALAAWIGGAPPR